MIRFMNDKACNGMILTGFLHILNGIQQTYRPQNFLYYQSARKYLTEMFLDASNDLLSVLSCKDSLPGGW